MWAKKIYERERERERENETFRYKNISFNMTQTIRFTTRSLLHKNQLIHLISECVVRETNMKKKKEQQQVKGKANQTLITF